MWHDLVAFGFSAFDFSTGWPTANRLRPRQMTSRPFSFKTGGPLKWIRKTPAERLTGRPN